MAKRTQSSQPRGRQTKANDTLAEPRENRVEELPNIPEPGDTADLAQRTESRFYESITPESITSESLTSESMASEPSEADIRLRAYQRYLERGAEHGSHVDDWFAAEDELKRRK